MGFNRRALVKGLLSIPLLCLSKASGEAKGQNQQILEFLLRRGWIQLGRLFVDEQGRSCVWLQATEEIKRGEWVAREGHRACKTRPLDTRWCGDYLGVTWSVQLPDGLADSDAGNNEPVLVVTRGPVSLPVREMLLEGVVRAEG